MKIKKKVLVTGSTGLVGKNFIDYLKTNPEKDIEWVFVSSKDADLRDMKETDFLFNKYNPNYVINLAGLVGGMYHNMNHNVEFFRYNMLINDNVMYCCHKYNVKKLISILSTCIFPEGMEKEMEEEDLHEGKPYKGNIGYAYAKRMTSILSQCYNEQYGTNFVTVIPGNLYGPHDHFDDNNNHVIPSLINRCYKTSITGEEFIIAGTGFPLRQFTYVTDFVKLLLWTLKRYNSNEPIILSTSEEVSIRQLANLIHKSMKSKSEMIQDLTKSDGQIRKTVSNLKLSTYLPNFKFTPINTGIDQTVVWYKEKMKDNQNN